MTNSQHCFMKHPARVHIILARDAETAIVIRRGPSKSVCTMLWDRQRDTFALGQWLRGRIYERRCDLSPDGKHFIYFAMNGKWTSDVKGSWTAISRTPHLKAIGLWANGSCWNGGGLFVTNRKYWLNAFRFGHEVRLNPSKLSQHEGFPFHESYGGECPGVYYIRLQRDGWRLAGHGSDIEDEVSTFEKDLPNGWVLRKTAHATINHPIGKGCYYDSHSLHHRAHKIDLDFPDWEWADWDRKRLVWVHEGMLFTSPLTAKGLGAEKQIYDFNPLTFEAIEAPY